MSSRLTVFRSYVIYPTPNILSQARKFTRKMCWRFLKVAEIQWRAAQARIFIETGKEISGRELRKVTLRKRLILTVLKLTEGLHWVNVAPGCLMLHQGVWWLWLEQEASSELWGSWIAVKISWTSCFVLTYFNVWFLQVTCKAICIFGHWKRWFRWLAWSSRWSAFPLNAHFLIWFFQAVPDHKYVFL